MSQPDVVLVFIGETGSGKSTCINYFANYCATTGFTTETGFNQMFVVIPNRLFPNAIGGYHSSESNIQDNTKSQTTKCNEYDFIDKNNGNKKVKVLDTPGFGDTDVSRDDQNIQNIIASLGKLPFISAIIITINGTVSRLSTAIKATLSQLRGSLPDSVFSNLFFIFTNCIDNTSRNFDLKLIDEYKPQQQRIFHMQNSLFSAASRSEVESDSKKKRRAVENWEDSVDTIKDLMNEVDRTVAASTKDFTQMRLQREQLLSNKNNLIVKQKSLLSIIHQLKIEADLLKNAQTNQTANQQYTQNQTISTDVIEKKNYYSTVCNASKHGIMQICHENCGLGYRPTLDYSHFKHCAASDGSNCRHCRCSMADHYHTYEIPVKRQVTTSQIIQSKKAAYDQATQQISNSQSQLQALNTTKNTLQADADSCKQGILSSIQELKKICSHFNFPEEMATTIQKLRQEAKIAPDLNAKAEFNKTADAIESLVKQLTV